jgi:hypothetical protein
MMHETSLTLESSPASYLRVSLNGAGGLPLLAGKNTPCHEVARWTVDTEVEYQIVRMRVECLQIAVVIQVGKVLRPSLSSVDTRDTGLRLTRR